MTLTQSVEVLKFSRRLVLGRSQLLVFCCSTKKMKSFLLCTAVVLTLLKTTVGDGCCTPDQWEGFQAGQTGYARLGGRPLSLMPGEGVNRFQVNSDNDIDEDKGGRGPPPVGIYLTENYIYYDYTNTQAAVYTNVTAGKYKRSYFILKKYSGANSTGRLYIVDLAKEKCFQRNLTRPFAKACIPDDAKVFPDFYFGAGDDRLNARSYYIGVRGKQFAVGVTATVTANGCVPVAEGVNGVIKKVAFMESIAFVNIKGSISDPSVFDVPEACKKPAEFDEEFDWLQAGKYSIFRAI